MATKTQTLGVNTPATVLSNEEILRYSRHLIMPEVGMDGQLKLKNARVLLIGTGGLGAPLGCIWLRREWENLGSSTLTWSTSQTCSASDFWHH